MNVGCEGNIANGTFYKSVNEIAVSNINRLSMHDYTGDDLTLCNVLDYVHDEKMFKFRMERAMREVTKSGIRDEMKTKMDLHLREGVTLLFTSSIANPSHFFEIKNGIALPILIRTSVLRYNGRTVSNKLVEMFTTRTVLHENNFMHRSSFPSRAFAV